MHVYKKKKMVTSIFFGKHAFILNLIRAHIPKKLRRGQQADDIKFRMNVYLQKSIQLMMKYKILSLYCFSKLAYFIYILHSAPTFLELGLHVRRFLDIHL